jgi:3-oxoacyl-[acyl-carrier protein] reductase
MKRALVTGGSRGLGFELCEALLHDEWSVVTCSRSSSPELDSLRAKYNDRLEHFSVDLANTDAVADFVKRAELIDGLDAFVANAAVGTEGLLSLTPDAAILHSLNVNLISTILLAREAIKGMITQKSGSLIFISSIAARRGMAGLSVYAAAKGALLSFSRSLAREYGEKNIRSNCILPGFFESQMSGSLSLQDRERIVRRSCLKKEGTSGQVIAAIQFLLSPGARFITGTELVVDGGFSC